MHASPLEPGPDDDLVCALHDAAANGVPLVGKQGVLDLVAPLGEVGEASPNHFAGGVGLGQRLLQLCQRDEDTVRIPFVHGGQLAGAPVATLLPQGSVSCVVDIPAAVPPHTSNGAIATGVVLRVRCGV
ncbi:MAG: hypothetical protein C0506_13485 [Anaerolinea sp.]|nr:hypothetical protein [Anaerolinea sp.]